MEMKLTIAAEQLPQPKLEFGELRKNAVQSKQVRNYRTMRRVLLAAVLVLGLCMTVFAYGGRQYGLWSGFHSKAFCDVKLLSWEYDYEFPQTLTESPFESVSVYYGAPSGASHLEALLKPTYKMCSIYYGIERMDEVANVWTANQISVSFGTTKNENWKYHFSVAEDGSCNYEDVTPDSQYSLEYEGYVLHFYSAGQNDSVRWEDQQRQMVLDVTCFNGELNALEVATELINLNK